MPFKKQGKMGLKMEHKWIVVVMIGIYLGLRFSKGGWIKAILPTLVSPIFLVPLFFTLSIAITTIGKFFVKAFGTLDEGTIRFVSDFSLAGAIAGTIGLFVFYCIWDREAKDIEIKGYAGGPVSRDNLSTANHALKRKML